MAEGLDLASLVQWAIDSGIDYALEYSVTTGLSFVQTTCAVISVLGAGTAAKRVLYPTVRSAEPLYRRLHAEGGPHLRSHRRLRFAVNPYRELRSTRAVILQGRTHEGKTTLLRTAIPWHNRWNIWPLRWLCWRGVYLNGADGCRNDSFEKWVTSQMFGITTSAGSELKRTLTEFRQSQWFRLVMEVLRLPVLLPRPMYVIVDQFEELMRKYPEKALPWADAVTHYHTRNNLARIIFVVNSEKGAQSLLNLNWRGTRFTKVVLNPLADDLLWMYPFIDSDIFAQCGSNIGLHSIVLEELAQGSLNKDDVPKFVARIQARWKQDFEVPFVSSIHPSWMEQELGTAKTLLVKGLERLLKVHTEVSEDNEAEITHIMAVVEYTLKRLDATQLYETSQEEWADALSNKRLAKPGLSSMDAKVVAKHIKRLMGHPARG